MPFHHHHDAEGGFLQILGNGEASAHEARMATRTFVRDHAAATSLPVLLDLCAMDDRVSDFDLEKLISYIEELRQTFKGKVAIVDSRAGHATICVLAATAVAQPDRVQAFIQEAHAKAWLMDTPME